MLTSISAVRNTETKFKVKRFQELVPKKMPLYHSKVVHWQGSNCKLHPGQNQTNFYKKLQLFTIYLERGRKGKRSLKFLILRRSNHFQHEELRRELISDEPSCIWTAATLSFLNLKVICDTETQIRNWNLQECIQISHLITCCFCYLEQNCIRLHVPYFKSREINFVHIGLRLTNITLKK